MSNRVPGPPPPGALPPLPRGGSTTGTGPTPVTGGAGTGGRDSRPALVLSPRRPARNRAALSVTRERTKTTQPFATVELGR
ncbi:hypothetical protein FHX37_1743 [Haloactinospora alba]|uniref:Uncharacterized protein n=1 Tax=Haloactinospora alba TaxID=405555 RepID=A0A543NJ03_9ACTN|nr:hypothetical protein FHX37_1743 [Haloactinospora alba]